MHSISEITLLLYLVSVAFTTAVLVRIVRQYALKRLIDIPNERSSHETPTPRGGGLAIALVFYFGVSCLWWVGELRNEVFYALLGGIPIALIGWVDDHRDVSARVRAGVHFVMAAWAVYWLGGLGELSIGEWSIPLGWLGSVLAVLGTVWLINLYNFMDGIDGIAGVQGASAAFIGGALFWLSGTAGLALISWLLAGACIGFLFWNWPPAKIFMGDVGSGLLGFLFAVIALSGEKWGGVPLLAWLILLAFFVMDATLTLTKRVINGEKWYTAHRSHAYQRLVQGGLSHGQVSSILALVNILILGSLAVLGWNQANVMPWALLGAIVIISFIWFKAQNSVRAC